MSVAIAGTTLHRGDNEEDIIPIYREADWQGRPRQSDSDLSKRNDAPFTYRFWDIKFPEFVQRVVHPGANIFRPADIRYLTVRARNHTEFSLDVQFDEFSLTLKREYYDHRDRDSLLELFVSERYSGDRGRDFTRTAFKVSYSTYSHSSKVPHHRIWEPAFELMRLANAHPQIFFKHERWSLYEWPAIVKPGGRIRGFEDCPDDILVIDHQYESDGGATYSDLIPLAAERFPNVRIVDHDYFLVEKTSVDFPTDLSVRDDRGLAFEEETIALYLFGERGHTIEKSKDGHNIYAPAS